MDRAVAVAYYPEGAGHATRMLAVAKALEARGVGVSLAGGGPGAKYVEHNGYEQFSPTAVDFVSDYQGHGAPASDGERSAGDDGSTDATATADGWTAPVEGDMGRFGGRRVGIAEETGSLARVFARSLPCSAKRVHDYVRWLRDLGPEAVVTDDMFAAMAAPVTNTPLYVLTHNTASYYDAVIEQAFTWLLNRYQLAGAGAFLYPAIWPPDHPGVRSQGKRGYRYGDHCHRRGLIGSSAFTVDRRVDFRPVGCRRTRRRGPRRSRSVGSREAGVPPGGREGSSARS